MSRSESIACTQCDGLAGDRCMVHDVEIENPAFTVCGAFRVVDTSPEELAARFPILTELRPDWIYELDPSGEPSPWLQVTRRRRGRQTAPTGRLAEALGEPAGAPWTPKRPERYAERAAGALVGLGLGDALGFPADGRAPQENDMVYGGPLAGPTGRIGRRHRYAVGQGTRHTQLALVLADSLLATANRFDPDDFAARLVRWLPGALKAGRTTQEAVEDLASGRHWAVSGQESNGSGAVCRLVPLAIAYQGLPFGRLRTSAILQSAITHAAPKAYAGATLFAAALAYVLSLEPAEPLRPANMLAFLEQAVRGIDAELSGRLTAIAALLEAGASPAEGLRTLRTGGYVLEGLSAALFAFLAGAEAPEATLLAAANAGFDASGTSAMVGALLGARHGLEGLPAAWVGQLPAAPTLEARARELAGAPGA